MQGHQKKYITLYMHCMVYHVPAMLKKFGNCITFPAKVCVKLMCTYINFYILQLHMCVLCIRYVHVHVHVGAEKNNDDSKRHYFSSNKMDAAAEVMRCDYRLEAMWQGVWVEAS